MIQPGGTSLRRDIKAATAVETVLVLGILLPMLFGGLGIGLIIWTQGTLQSVAALTARCVAISSSACTNPQQYAVTLATAWLGSAMITTANVTVAAATACPNAAGASGPFEVVTISASPWVHSITYPLAGNTQTVTACFPT